MLKLNLSLGKRNEFILFLKTRINTLYLFKNESNYIKLILFKIFIALKKHLKDKN